MMLDELENLFYSSSYNGYTINCFCNVCGEQRTFENTDKTVHEEDRIYKV